MKYFKTVSDPLLILWIIASICQTQQYLGSYVYNDNRSMLANHIRSVLTTGSQLLSHKSCHLNNGTLYYSE
jgi:hypothetical protein